MCPDCHADVKFEQPGLVSAGKIASATLGVLSTIVLAFFGCLGGINALVGHGIFVFIFLVLAVLSGMRIRTVFFILAIYFAVVMFLSIQWTGHPAKKKTTTASLTTGAILRPSGI